MLKAFLAVVEVVNAVVKNCSSKDKGCFDTDEVIGATNGGSF